jgi:hypothetical protein
MPTDDGLDTLGVYTGRSPSSQTTLGTVEAAPDPHRSESTPGTAPPEPVAPVPPNADANLVADLSREFSKNIGEQPGATTTPPETRPELDGPRQPAATEPPKEKEPDWRQAPPPVGATKKVAETWNAFKAKAQADIEARDSRIKVLESEMSKMQSVAPQTQAQLDELKKQLLDSHGLVERVAIERSPLFKTKITDQENLLKARLAKVLDGTGITPQEAAGLLSGDLNTRERIVEPRNMSGFRKQQISDLLARWDTVNEEKERMLSRGRETLQEYLKEQQTAQEANKAQFMRESAKTFEDQLSLIGPKLEVYNQMEGNEPWNNNVNSLKAAARRIFDGQVDRSVLAQAAILAPAAVAFQQLLRIAHKRILDLEGQNNKLRGVSPEIRDTGADVAQPGRILSSSNGDFVKDLVSRFQKDTGLQ